MEGRFGESFGAVQVHADADAGDAAKQHGARAFTLGNDIVFGHGQYQPGTRQGKRLIAHELAHVVQQQRGQGGGRVDRALTEGEAHRAADHAGRVAYHRGGAVCDPEGRRAESTPIEPKVKPSFDGGSYGHREGEWLADHSGMGR